MGIATVDFHYILQNVYFTNAAISRLRASEAQRATINRQKGTICAGDSTISAARISAKHYLCLARADTISVWHFYYRRIHDEESTRKVHKEGEFQSGKQI